MKEQNKIVRIRSWEEFVKVTTTLHPRSIAYTFEKSPFSKPPLAMRLSFGVEGTQYIFIDFAQGNALKLTKIPVYIDKGGQPYLKDEEVKSFIHSQLNLDGLSIVSFGVLGY